MTRTLPIWHGKTDDAAIPDRVRLRVLEKAGGRCEACTRKVGPALPFEIDHRIRLADGGKHSEDNLQILCIECHAQKSGEEKTAKAKRDRIIKKRYGIGKPKRRPLPGTRASGIRKRMDGTVERWP